MIRGISAGSEMLLAQLDRMDGRLAKAQRQISSGLRVSTASDAPDEVSAILTLRADLERNSQISTNLECAKVETATADDALQKSVQDGTYEVGAGKIADAMLTDLVGPPSGPR